MTFNQTNESCRICEISNDTVLNPITDVCKYIAAVAQIQVDTAPELPQFVCDACVEHLMEAYAIREMCIQSEVRLLQQDYDIDEEQFKYEESDEPVYVEADELKAEIETGAFDDEEISKVMDTVDIDDSEVETDVEESLRTTVIEKRKVKEAEAGVQETTSMTVIQEKVKEEEVKLESPVEESQNKEESCLVEDNDDKSVIEDKVSSADVTTARKRGRPKIEVLDDELYVRTKRQARSCIRIAETSSAERPDRKSLKKECCQCDFKTPLLSAMMIHFKEMHADIKLPELDSSILQCHLCRQPFETKEELLAHAQQPMSRKKKFQCVHCGKECCTYKALHAHLDRHNDIEKFPCDQCDAVYTARVSLKAHQTNVHDGVRFVCDECGASFRRMITLREHKNVHLDIRPFECPICDSKFHRRTALRTHLQVHTGEKPYACDYCGRRFGFKTDKDRHMSQHTRVYKFNCTHCGYGCVRRMDFERHMLNHKLEVSEGNDMKEMVGT